MAPQYNLVRNIAISDKQEQRKAEIKDPKLEELTTYDNYDQEMIAYQKQEEKELLELFKSKMHYIKSVTFYFI